MLISDPTPTCNWYLSGIGGSTWSFAAGTANLTNGRPRNGARVFRDEVVGGFELQARWATLSKPRLFALLGLGPMWKGLSFGLSVANAAGGGSSVDLGTVSVRQLADGSFAAFAVLPDLASAVDSLTITCGTGFDATHYDIGEAVIATATEWAIRRDWSESATKLGKTNVTKSGQAYHQNDGQFRKASVTIAPQPWSRALGTAEGGTLQQLKGRLTKSPPVLVIPHLRAPGLGASAPIDMDAVAGSALFGWAHDLGTLGLFQETNLSELRLQFTEAPGYQFG